MINFSFYYIFPQLQDGKSVMTKIYNTLGRSRGKKELENNHFGGDDIPVRFSFINVILCNFYGFQSM